MPNYITGIIAAVALVLASAMLAFAARWVLRNTVSRIYRKAESRVDDVIIRSIERPLMLLILTAGVYAAIMLVLYLGMPGLSETRAVSYIAKINKVFAALSMLIAAYGGLTVFNRLTAWYASNSSSSGLAHQLRMLRKVLSMVIWALVAVMVLNQLGYKVSTLLATLGIAGLAVALALQDTLANIFAGFYVVADRSLRVGDYVKLDSGEEGFVEEIGWRNTRIRLWANNMVIVPNSKLIQSILTNYDLPQQELSVYVRCGVGYDSDLDHVEKVTVDVAKSVLRNVPGSVHDYEPVVRFKEFGDSNIDFVVVLRAKDAAAQFLIHHEFIKRLHRRYKEEGINISFPVRMIVPAPTDN